MLAQHKCVLLLRILVHSGPGRCICSVEFCITYNMYLTISYCLTGETNLDALMTTLITAVEEHNVQLEREIQEEVCIFHLF